MIAWSDYFQLGIVPADHIVASEIALWLALLSAISPQWLSVNSPWLPFSF